jgi:HAD superfamily hydrolase (TIGR01509 family)
VLVGLDPRWPERLGVDPTVVAQCFASDPVFHAFERGMTSRERFYGGLAAHLEREPSAVREAFNAWVTGPLPGAADLLDRVVVPCFAASNTNVDHWAVFDPQRELRDRFVALASHHLGARKPERAFFARATAIIGSPAVLFLDDRADNVAAARAFGWRAEQVVGVSDCQAVLQDAGLLR